MRAMSSAVSITLHIALGAAVLFGTAKTGRSTPATSTLQTGAPGQLASPTSLPSNATTVTGYPSDGWGPALGEAGPEVLTGPLPVYPELLRRAGVQGQVLLEAVVDTTGRVLAPSISVISATNPGFVAPARQALVATLFRPARVGGRAVTMLVRVPFDFTIRGGTGRAR